MEWNGILRCNLRDISRNCRDLAGRHNVGLKYPPNIEYVLGGYRMERNRVLCDLVICDRCRDLTGWHNMDRTDSSFSSKLARHRMERLDILCNRRGSVNFGGDII